NFILRYGSNRSYELNEMGGVGHEDYYPRLCDCSRRRCDDRFWALGALHSDQGKGRSEALHTDVPNNSCRSCPNWPCPGLAPVARVGGLPVNDLRLAMPLYWLVYRHNNQISVVIEPAHSLIYARLRASLDGLDEGQEEDGREDISPRENHAHLNPSTHLDCADLCKESSSHAVIDCNERFRGELHPRHLLASIRSHVAQAE